MGLTRPMRSAIHGVEILKLEMAYLIWQRIDITHEILIVHEATVLRTHQRTHMKYDDEVAWGRASLSSKSSKTAVRPKTLIQKYWSSGVGDPQPVCWTDVYQIYVTMDGILWEY